MEETKEHEQSYGLADTGTHEAEILSAERMDLFGRDTIKVQYHTATGKINQDIPLEVGGNIRESRRGALQKFIKWQLYSIGIEDGDVDNVTDETVSSLQGNRVLIKVEEENFISKTGERKTKKKAVSLKMISAGGLDALREKFDAAEAPDEFPDAW